MPVLRMYKDDENDFIDMMETNFKIFIRQVRSIQICDRAVVTLKKLRVLRQLQTKLEYQTTGLNLSA